MPSFLHLLDLHRGQLGGLQTRTANRADPGEKAKTGDETDELVLAVDRERPVGRESAAYVLHEVDLAGKVEAPRGHS